MITELSLSRETSAPAFPFLVVQPTARGFRGPHRLRGSWARSQGDSRAQFGPLKTLSPAVHPYNSYSHSAWHFPFSHAENGSARKPPGQRRQELHGALGQGCGPLVGRRDQTEH